MNREQGGTIQNRLRGKRKKDREGSGLARVPGFQGREGWQVAGYGELVAGGLSESGQKVATPDVGGRGSLSLGGCLYVCMSVCAHACSWLQSSAFTQCFPWKKLSIHKPAQLLPSSINHVGTYLHFKTNITSTDCI